MMFLRFPISILFGKSSTRTGPISFTTMQHGSTKYLYSIAALVACVRGPRELWDFVPSGASVEPLFGQTSATYSDRRQLVLSTYLLWSWAFATVIKSFRKKGMEILGQ